MEPVGPEHSIDELIEKTVFTREMNAVFSFAGNAEGRDIMGGSFDVIVTDGFTGNVALKTLEGTAKVLFAELKGAFSATPVTKLEALTVKNEIGRAHV